MNYNVDREIAKLKTKQHLYLPGAEEFRALPSTYKNIIDIARSDEGFFIASRDTIYFSSDLVGFDEITPTDFMDFTEDAESTQNARTSITSLEIESVSYGFGKVVMLCAVNTEERVFLYSRDFKDWYKLPITSYDLPYSNLKLEASTNCFYLFSNDGYLAVFEGNLSPFRKNTVLQEHVYGSAQKTYKARVYGNGIFFYNDTTLISYTTSAGIVSNVVGENILEISVSEGKLFLITGADGIYKSYNFTDSKTVNLEVFEAVTLYTDNFIATEGTVFALLDSVSYVSNNCSDFQKIKTTPTESTKVVKSDTMYLFLTEGGLLYSLGSRSTAFAGHRHSVEDIKNLSATLRSFIENETLRDLYQGQTSEAIIEKLLDVDGPTSGLDAQYIGGTPYTDVISSKSGNTLNIVREGFGITNTTTGAPVTTFSSWGYLNIKTSSTTYLQIVSPNSNTDKRIWFRKYNGSSWSAYEEFVTTYNFKTTLLANDGSGSQLDADLLDNMHAHQFAKYGTAQTSLLTTEAPTASTTGNTQFYRFYDINNVIGEGTYRYYMIYQVYYSSSYYARIAVSCSTGKLYKQSSGDTSWSELSPLIAVVTEDPSNPSNGEMWIRSDLM